MTYSKLYVHPASCEIGSSGLTDLAHLSWVVLGRRDDSNNPAMGAIEERTLCLLVVIDKIFLRMQGSCITLIFSCIQNPLIRRLASKTRAGWWQRNLSGHIHSEHRNSFYFSFKHRLPGSRSVFKYLCFVCVFCLFVRIKLSFFRSPLETQIHLNSECGQRFRFISYLNLISYTDVNQQSLLANSLPQMENFRWSAPDRQYPKEFL